MPTTIRGVSRDNFRSQPATSSRVRPFSSRTVVLPPAPRVQTPAQICRRCPAASTRPDQSIPTKRLIPLPWLSSPEGICRLALDEATTRPHRRPHPPPPPPPPNSAGPPTPPAWRTPLPPAAASPAPSPFRLPVSASAFAPRMPGPARLHPPRRTPCPRLHSPSPTLPLSASAPAAPAAAQTSHSPAAAACNPPQSARH